MTVIEVEGKQVDVGDEFLKLAPEHQQATVQQIALQINGGKKSGLAAPKPSFDDIGQGRAEGVNMLRGVPIAGAYADKAAAALNAAAQPVMETGLSNAPSFGERMSENEARIKEGTDAYGREKPVATMAQQFAGGTAALAPLAASSVAARALGMSGTLPQMVARGGASGAAIGGLDEAARGGSPIHGAEVGALTGAGFPVAGRIIGRGVQALRGGATPREARTSDVNGVQVPRFESQVTGDNAAGSLEQAALSGAQGEKAQQIAQQALEARTAAMEQARGKFGAELSPETNPALGAPPEATPATPHQAGDQVVTELAARQNAEMQRDALRGVASEVSDFQTRDALSPAGGMPATAMEASQIVGGRIGGAAREAAQARTGAYQRAGEVEGEFSPAAFERISNSLEQRLNSGAPEQRVRVNANTPRAREALDIIENEIGSGRRPTNEVDPRTTNYNAALDDGVRMQPAHTPPVTGRDLEAVRQQLVPLVRDANNAARAPGGSAADARAMRRLMDAFNDHVRDVVRAGGFSGDGAELMRRYEIARAAHSSYRGTFSARGQGDIVGPTIEKIIGKHPGQELQPDAIASSMYGSASNPGGGNTVAMAQRARQILGPESAEWGAAKQGYLSNMLDTPHGTAPLSPLEQAERIYTAVNGKGSALTQVYLTPDEIGRLTAHADMLRNLFPTRGPMNAVDKQIARLSGADGHPPASSRDVVDSLIGTDATKASSIPLLTRLKQTLSPESWDSIRQGVWSRLSTKPEGMIEFGPQALSQRIHKFLSEPHAEVLYSAKERQMMKIIADEYKSQIPLANTTNPSGSGIFATKMVRAAQGNLLPLLGLATHGPVGVLGGMAANKALAFAGGRRAEKKALDLFQGKAKVSVPGVGKSHSRAAAILAKAAQPLVPLVPPQQSTGQ